MQEYVQKYRKRYQKLRPVFCKALGEVVYFSSEGFNHLLFKHGHKRTEKEIKYRLPLVNLIVPVLKNSEQISNTRVQNEMYKGKIIEAYYFEISHFVGEKDPTQVHVIVKKRSKSAGLFFLSVMKEK